MGESIDRRIESYPCIKKMDKTYLAQWKKIRDHYKGELDCGAILKKTAFTLHDYSHHCKNIYNIIGKLIPESVLTSEEYFILNTAVLLHDISMTQTNFDRLKHSKESSERLQEDKGLDCWEGISELLIDHICKIIQAHSDCKMKQNGAIVTEEHTLENTTLTNRMEAEDGNKKIRGRFLAGLLRLADELDITRERIGGKEREYEQLDDNVEEERISKEHWECLRCFKNVTIKGTEIYLELDEQYLRNIGDDRSNLEQRIWKTRNKVEESLEYINRTVFEEEECCKLINLRYVKFQLNGVELGENIVEGTRKKAEKSHMENLLSPEIEEKITMYIYENKLVHSGHYRMNDEYCGKNWVDVRPIISDKNFYVDPLGEMEIDIKKSIAGKEEVLFAGIGINGNIMASRFGFRLQVPFTYILPFRPGSIGSPPEKEVEIEKYENIVLFTGVLASYKTVMRLIGKYGLENKILKVYTVLFREMPQYAEELKELRKKVTALNMDFPCEIINEDQCIMKKYRKECIAINSQAYEEVYGANS